jgi:hypothetical protein
MPFPLRPPERVEHQQQLDGRHEVQIRRVGQPPIAAAGADRAESNEERPARVG